MAGRGEIGVAAVAAVALLLAADGGPAGAKVSRAGAVVGTLAGAKGLSGAGVRSPLPRAMPKRMIAGAGVGAGAGYVEGFSRGESLEDRLERGQGSAKWGAAFGGLAPVVANSAL
jgi:hypothetical protein